MSYYTAITCCRNMLMESRTKLFKKMKLKHVRLKQAVQKMLIRCISTPALVRQKFLCLLIISLFRKAVYIRYSSPLSRQITCRCHDTLHRQDFIHIIHWNQYLKCCSLLPWRSYQWKSGRQKHWHLMVKLKFKVFNRCREEVMNRIFDFYATKLSLWYSWMYLGALGFHEIAQFVKQICSFSRFQWSVNF